MNNRIFNGTVPVIFPIIAPPILLLKRTQPLLEPAPPTKIDFVYFNGECESDIDLSTTTLTSVNPLFPSSFDNMGELSLYLDMNLCGDTANENCTVQNYYLIDFSTPGEGTLSMPGVLINYAVLLGTDITIPGTMYLRVGSEQILTDVDNTILGRYPGSMIVDYVTVPSGGKIIFDDFLPF